MRTRLLSRSISLFSLAFLQHALHCMHSSACIAVTDSKCISSALKEYSREFTAHPGVGYKLAYKYFNCVDSMRGNVVDFVERNSLSILNIFGIIDAQQKNNNF